MHVCMRACARHLAWRTITSITSINSKAGYCERFGCILCVCVLIAQPVHTFDRAHMGANQKKKYSCSECYVYVDSHYSSKVKSIVDKSYIIRTLHGFIWARLLASVSELYYDYIKPVLFYNFEPNLYI
jgi:hypothetical protein